MKVERFSENPLIKPEDVTPSHEGWEVICVFNAGVTRYNDEVLLLMRVAERPIGSDPRVVRIPMLKCERECAEMHVLDFSREDGDADFSDSRIIYSKGQAYLTSISHLRIARSKDGRHFTIDEKPAIIPDRASEAYGLEDPRITEIDGTYYIIYKSVAPTGISQSIATTRDFVTFEKHGVILPPENMDAMMFPGKIGGKFAALHRPFPHAIGQPNMWVGYSEDAIHWGEHRYLAGVVEGGWEGGRIGGGVVPFMTDRGWLEIYHGATPDDKYSLGAMLLDSEHPERIIARSREPIMQPEASYEVSGFVPNVVFSCGALVDGDRVIIYYGGADTVIAGAELSVKEILASLES